MIDKLIRNRVIEIIIVSILTIISYPIWQNNGQKFNETKAFVNDIYSLDFEITQSNGLDTLLIANNYQINRHFIIELYLKAENNQEQSLITINDETYELKDFKRRIENDHYIYIIIDEYISAELKSYNISYNFMKDNIEYYYKINETAIF